MAIFLDTGFPVSDFKANFSGVLLPTVPTSSISFSTSGTHRLLVACVSFYPPISDPYPIQVLWSGSVPTGATTWSMQTYPEAVTGDPTTEFTGAHDGGIHWTSQIWTAAVSETLTNVKMYASRSGPNAELSTGVISVYSFGSASFTIGARAQHHTPMSEVGGAGSTINVPITATADNSVIVGVAQWGNLPSGNTFTPNGITSIDFQDEDGGSDGGAAAFRKTGTTVSGTGYLVGMTDSQYAWTISAIEVLESGTGGGGGGPAEGPRPNALYLISGTVGGRMSRATLYFTYDGARHPPGGGGGGGGMSIIARASGTNLATGVAATASISAGTWQANDVLIATVTTNNNTVDVNTVTSPSLTWTRRVYRQNGGSNGYAAIYTAVAGSGQGGAETVSMNDDDGSNGGRTILVNVIRGANAAQSFNLSGTAAGSTAAASCSLVSAPAASSMVFGAFQLQSLQTTTPGTDTTEIWDVQTGGSNTNWHVSRSNGSTGQTLSGTFTGGAAWVGVALEVLSA